ncbi:MAG: pilus assembly PilX N-terminal domain-containing protein [Candidatus Paceibacterota bacterium]
MKIQVQKRSLGKRGITLLVALLVMNVLLAVGLSISNLSYKSLRLSSSGEDTQYAYYAAEAGFECAQYHDKNVAFSNGVTEIECNGESLSVTTTTSPTSDFDVYSFTLPFLDETYCARLTVQKPDDDTGQPTIIETRGYNTCNEDAPSIVERGIRIYKY